MHKNGFHVKLTQVGTALPLQSVAFFFQIGITSTLMFSCFAKAVAASVKAVATSALTFPYFAQVVAASALTFPYFAQVAAASALTFPCSAQAVAASALTFPCSAQAVAASA
ncbi:beta-glucosidase Psu1 (predicted) [Tolypothrix sp. PCC 7601]|nr:beta-glucosidase Psu1 (predicted) [Tolypothrix sp. PCC 7601]